MCTWHTCLQGVLKLMHWLVTSWHLWRGVAGRGRPISPSDKARYEGPRLLAMLFGLDCQRCRPCCCQAVLLWRFLAPVQHSTCLLDLVCEAWAACHAWGMVASSADGTPLVYPRPPINHASWHDWNASCVDFSLFLLAMQAQLLSGDMTLALSVANTANSATAKATMKALAA